MRQNILRDCRKDENQLSRPLERSTTGHRYIGSVGRPQTSIDTWEKRGKRKEERRGQRGEEPRAKTEQEGAGKGTEEKGRNMGTWGGKAKGVIGRKKGRGGGRRIERDLSTRELKTRGDSGVHEATSVSLSGRQSSKIIEKRKQNVPRALEK
ncbi:Hypothetical predicted protein [Mytilus galloprovincialis]|uniref:Uncharacterized protein n=1 Tax=Mytilus galloprovincialis TaxID=29158 RepID=A0A8B6DUZ8_MYTGA|nr:Hypothetical predicted protein [Mytilus galloprovincialis]